MNSEVIQVILADDHKLVLEGLQSILQDEDDIKVMAAVTDGAQLLEALRQYPADVVVLDIQMPFADGLTCLEKIRRDGPPAKVLVLSAFSDGETIQSALELGADGFALKTEPPEQTISSIRQVYRGSLVFPQAAKKWLFARRAASERQAELSEREWEVLELVAEGLTNAQIGEKLFVSDNTVKFHLQNIYQKLGVSNRTEATSYFFKHHRPRP